MNILEPPQKGFIVYYKDGCPYSEAAVQLLDSHKIKYKLTKPDSATFKKRFGMDATYPRIYDNEQFIGGFDDLNEKFSSN